MKLLFRQITGSLMAIVLSGYAATSGASVIETYTKRADYKSAILDAGFEKHTQGFNRVKGVKKGGQRSFASIPLDLGDFTMQMVADEGVRIPKGKRNRVTKRKRFRINKTKYAWVKTKDGVDLVLTFDTEIYAFGAKFRGLNNDRASTSILLDSGVLGQLEPAKTRKRKKSFFGFVSNEAFTSITFSGKDSFGMDKLIYATMPATSSPSLFVEPSATELGDIQPPTQAAVASVPVPSSFLLMVLGMLSLGVTRLKRSLS